MKTSYFSRTCRYCGRRFEPQKREDGPRALFEDAAGRQSYRVSTAVQAMPAYLCRAVHERTCEKKESHEQL